MTYRVIQLNQAREAIKEAMSKCQPDTYFTSDLIVKLVQQGGRHFPEQVIRDALLWHDSEIARRSTRRY
jgi:hypothetical protein